MSLRNFQQPHLQSLAMLAVACLVGIIGCSTQSMPKSQLAVLLTTNAPCHVALEPFWVGKRECTVRTGFFTNAEPPELMRLNHELRFDWFCIWEKPAFLDGVKILGQHRDGGLISLHAWRSALPSDADLLSATTTSALERMLGRSMGMTDTWGDMDKTHSAESWQFFTLAKPGEIETVSIFCLTVQRKGDQEWRVESVRVIRGKATPASR